jgi:hypothetical protein
MNQKTSQAKKMIFQAPKRLDEYARPGVNMEFQAGKFQWTNVSVRPGRSI